MGTFIWFGTAVGFVVGLIHAVHIFREHHAVEPYGLAAAIYRSIWGVILWSLFGAYLLVFWFLGSILMLLSGRSPLQSCQARAG